MKLVREEDDKKLKCGEIVFSKKNVEKLMTMKLACGKVGLELREYLLYTASNPSHLIL